MKKFYAVFLGLLVSGGAFAEESAGKPESLNLAVRRIGLEWSKTDVRHAAEYHESPVSALKADSQDFIKAVFDTGLEYNKGRFQCDNSLFMEYGETKLKPYNEPATTSENADDILLSSNLSYACWDFSGFKFGFVKAAPDIFSIYR